MKRPLVCRAGLLAAALFALPTVRAAEAASDDDENPVVTGKVRDVGSRKAEPEIAPASDEATQALRRMKVPEGLEIKLWAA